ncbi:MAG TPA: hypothetical protein IAC01_00730 [Candidatus Limicola stercorigallinarum]|nr:hypothetical protein [Candidatus Limicola stercorigallinarum]
MFCYTVLRTAVSWKQNVSGRWREQVYSNINLHLHDVSQPDLDWTNPEVREQLAQVVRFWKDRGVEGFRFDVVNLISKPDVLVDAPDGSGRRIVADGPTAFTL